MRLPNPWIAIPALVAGGIAAWVGYVVTDVSCRVDLGDGTISTCSGWAVAISIISFLIATIGMAVVIDLIYRSLAESREDTAQPKRRPN